MSIGLVICVALAGAFYWYVHAAGIKRKQDAERAWDKMINEPVEGETEAMRLQRVDRMRRGRGA